MYQVFINTNKDLGNKIINNLKTYNISSITVPSNNKVNYIKNNSNNKSIVITIDNSKNIEVIYSIKRNDKLANIISNNFEKNKYIVSKVYQRRDSIKTSNDYDEIINDVPIESIIIKAPINDVDISNIITNSILEYLGIGSIKYKVKKGDTLYSIARKYNTTVDSIKKLNNLKGNLINIGQILNIK